VSGGGGEAGTKLEGLKHCQDIISPCDMEVERAKMGEQGIGVYFIRHSIIDYKRRLSTSKPPN